MTAIDTGILKLRNAIDQGVLQLRNVVDSATLKFRSPIDSGVLNTQLLSTGAAGFDYTLDFTLS